MTAATRYAIRRQDGKFLAVSKIGGRELAVWVEDRASAYTWSAMLLATLAGMDPDGLNLEAAAAWDVVPVLAEAHT